MSFGERAEVLAERLRAVVAGWQRGDGVPEELDDIADQIEDLGCAMEARLRHLRASVVAT